MHNFNSLLGAIKKSAVEAVQAEKPVFMTYGTVTGVNPLEINVNQKLILEDEQLILTRNVTDYEVEMLVNHTTEDYAHTHTISDTYTGGGSASNDTHNHEYKGRKIFTIHNSLKVGENVILARVQGGQKYIVLDRVGI